MFVPPGAKLSRIEPSWHDDGAAEGNEGRGEAAERRNGWSEPLGGGGLHHGGIHRTQSLLLMFAENKLVWIFSPGGGFLGNRFFYLLSRGWTVSWNQLRAKRGKKFERTIRGFYWGFPCFSWYLLNTEAQRTSGCEWISRRFWNDLPVWTRANQVLPTGNSCREAESKWLKAAANECWWFGGHG